MRNWRHLFNLLSPTLRRRIHNCTNSMTRLSITSPHDAYPQAQILHQFTDSTSSTKQSVFIFRYDCCAPGTRLTLDI